MPEKLSSGPKKGFDLSRGAGLSRGENRQKQVSNAPYASGVFPAPNSSLDLDFANDRGFVRGLGQGKSMDGVTFTRASNGTYVGPDGLLKSYSNQGALGKNLLTFPQDFDNAVWYPTRATIIKNTEIAPDGTMTAELLVEDTTINNSHYIYTNSLGGSGTKTGSYYVKYAGRRYVSLVAFNTTDSDRSRTYFDLLNGNVVSGPGSISPIENGWYRCSISATSTVNDRVDLRLSLTGTSESYTGDGVSGIYIWGAQLELGSTATPYYPTNIGLPRFDWASTDSLSRNTLRYSQEFNNTAAWAVTNATITANATTAPDGTASAFKVVPATGTRALNSDGPTQAFAADISSGQRLVASCHAKMDAARYLAMGFSNFAGYTATVVFDLQTGLVSGTGTHPVTGAFVSASMADVGAGWYRCIFVYDYIGPMSALHVTASTTAASGLYLRNITGDGTSGVFIWGSQLEIGDIATAYKATGAQTPTNTPLASTSSCNGLLIEESRTNRILYCRDATQANWICSNTTPLLNQTGIDSVANAASSLTATADNGTCIQTITLASGARTCSVYLKRLIGTGTIQVSLDGTTWSTVDLSETEWRRIVLSGTVTNPVVGIKIVTNGDSVAMDFAQVEDNLNATSPIMTTSASATRSADISIIEKSNFISWYNPAKFTIFVDITLQGKNGSATASTVCGWGVSINNNSFFTGIGYDNRNTVGIVSPSANIPKYYIAPLSTKISQAFFTNGSAGTIANVLAYGSIDGMSFPKGTGGAGDYNFTTYDRFGIGCIPRSTSIGSFVNGTISRIIFYPYQLSQEAMNQLTK